MARLASNVAAFAALLFSVQMSRAQWCECLNAPPDCVNSTQDFNIDERFDCGPYVPRFRCEDAATGDGCGGAGLSLTFPIDNDEPSVVNPPDPQLSEEDLDAYKTLELELLADILKNDPLFPEEGETKLDLPYCGMLSDSSAKRRDTPVYASSIFKRGWGSIFKGIKWPTLSSGPKRPVFPNLKKPKPPSVRVVFNVIATNYTSQEKITDAVLDQAVAELNRAYNIRMKISFFRDPSVHRFTEPGDDDYRKITQYVRGDVPDNFMMRDEFRYGGKDVLHVFVLESIRRGENRLNGFCYFPDSSLDGCAIAYDTLTGVSHQDCDETGRGTLIHEVGHWLGLKHTHDESNDNVCRGSNDIAVIPQFPFQKRFCDTQHPCSTGKNPSVQTGTDVRMTNYMSYAFSRGTPYVQNVGPWVAEQQAKAWTNFHSFRAASRLSKRELLGEQSGPSLYKRLMLHRERQARAQNLTLSARGILSSRPNIREELLAICQTPWTEGEDKSIDDTILDKDKDSSVIPDPRDDISTPGGTDKGTGSGKDKGSGNGKGGGKSNGGGSSGGSGGGSNSGDGGSDGGSGARGFRTSSTPAFLAAFSAVVFYFFEA